MKKIISILSVFYLFSMPLIGGELPLPTSFPDEGEVEVKGEPPGTYQFLYDKNFTPYAGGGNLLTLHKGIEKLDAHSPLKEKQGVVPTIARLFELTLGWTPINYMTMVVQHEVFGHGYRMRDFGKGVGSVTKYEFNLPPPFGPGGAATHFEFKSLPSPTQRTVLAGGGMEATGILAHQIRMEWMRTGTIPAQEAGLYNFAQTDIVHYVNSIKSDHDLHLDSEGHDVATYLNALHLSYPYGTPSIKELKRMAKIQFLDPFTYFASYSWLKYLFTGYSASVPSFTFGSVSYLPSPRLTLSPFGPEYTLDNYIKFNDVPSHVYVKRGRFAKNTFYGCGFLNESLITYRAHAFGARLDLWRQPKILSLGEWEEAFMGFLHHNIPEIFTSEELSHTPSTQPMRTMHFGGAFALIYNYALFPERLAMHLELGYKTDGYLAGESLTKGVLAKLALNARF